MVDRDPVNRWTWGRVTLLGDVAHPMYPRGVNGGVHAILGAQYLARFLEKFDDPQFALSAYEEERLNVTNKIVLINRTQPSNYIIETVETLTLGEPFDRIEDVTDSGKLAVISNRCKDIARYNLDKN